MTGQQVDRAHVGEAGDGHLEEFFRGAGRVQRGSYVCAGQIRQCMAALALCPLRDIPHDVDHPGRAAVAPLDRELDAAPEPLTAGFIVGLAAHLEVGYRPPGLKHAVQRPLDEADVHARQYLRQPAPAPLRGRPAAADLPGRLVSPGDQQLRVEDDCGQRRLHEPLGDRGFLGDRHGVRRRDPLRKRFRLGPGRLGARLVHELLPSLDIRFHHAQRRRSLA
jgi:hypothetical protein